MSREILWNEIQTYCEKFPEESSVCRRFSEFMQEFENCFERECEHGHLTGSAWVLNPKKNCVLLLHHAKLNRWLQPGGHCDGETDPRKVALKEVREETGLTDLEFLSPDIFDLDIHTIPPHQTTPAHFHYDLRFLLSAHEENLKKNEESNDLRWVAINQITEYTKEISILRLWQKTEKFLNP